METNINILEDFNQIEFHYIFEYASLIISIFAIVFSAKTKDEKKVKRLKTI